ncbi:MAG: ATP-dependent helicase/deoxyribonuclease subunit B [Phycisphaerae bacterium]|nr:ATP-dependent helicase/deoxyribonuclease subunit B [Phycisphaerae bacterium]
MSVRFVIGRSGAGKTRHCLDAVRRQLADSPADGPPLILLVPEQATFQVERALLDPAGEGTPLGGHHRARVLSFQRFAGLLFNELGGPEHPPISALAKQMALRAVLEPLGKRLPTFAPSIDRPGFLARLADLFRELHQYEVTADQLRERASAEPSHRLAAKLADLAEAFDAFEAYLKQAEFSDPDAALTVARGLLERSRLAAGASVWVDGFAGFTPQELSFLGELVRVAAAAEIALVMDPRAVPAWPGPMQVPLGRLFRRSEDTYLRLRRHFDHRGLPVGPPLLLERVHRFAADSPLVRIEREMFEKVGGGPNGAASSTRNSDLPPQLLAHRNDRVVLVEAPDRRAEVRAAVAQVRHLVSASGWRFRDIAVILRSLEEYWQLLVEAFADAGIPCFIDRRQPIAHHPLVELLRSAVAGIATGFAPASGHLIAWLKTDLPASMFGDDCSNPLAAYRDAVDRLENYALAYGIGGDAWFRPDRWRFHEHTGFGAEDLGDSADCRPDSHDRMVDATARVLAPLAELHKLARAQPDGPTVEQWTDGLWRMLQRLRVADTLEAWSAGDPGHVHRQALDAVEALLADLRRSLGERQMTPAVLVQVLEAGLSQLTLGLVPPSLDQVLISAIERSRHPRIRAALVLGMGERCFPRLAAVQSILTDGDRQALAEAGECGGGNAECGMKPGDQPGLFDDPFPAKAAASSPTLGTRHSALSTSSGLPAVELAPGRSELLFDEDLMAYLALTRPGERLWVSYPASDDAGRPLGPSRYLRRLRELLPETPLVRIADQPAPLAALTAGELAGVLGGRFAGRIGDDSPTPLEAACYGLLRNRGPAALLPLESLAYANEPGLSAEVAAGLFVSGRSRRLAGSVTRLESFAACPFQHLAGHGLRLQPRERIEMDALQLGRFYHEILRQLFDRLAEGGRLRWSDHAPADLRAAVRELVDKARDELDLPRLEGGAVGWLLQQAEEALGDLAEAMAAASSAAPTLAQAAAELTFGTSERGALPALTVALGGGVSLALRGKIDRLDLADSGEAFVVDYKTGQRAVDWTGIAHGLSLQLTAYLLAIDQHGGKLAAGAKPAGAFYQRITVSPPTGDAPARDEEKSAVRDYRRRGLFLADAADLLDASVAGGGSSPFVAYLRNKDGSLSARGNDAVSAGQLAGLMRLARMHMRKWGREILAGRSAVEPYRIRHAGPCSLCDFRSVCRLDFEYNRLRYLQPAGRGEVLATLPSDEGDAE